MWKEIPLWLILEIVVESFSYSLGMFRLLCEDANFNCLPAAISAVVAPT